MARTRAKSKKAVLKVDFTGVESSGKVEEGRQVAEVVECEVKTSDSSGCDYINWKLKAKGGTIYHTTSLQPQALWNLRNVLEALGLEVPEDTLELDLSEYPGMELGVEVEHETHQGKKKPVLVDVFPLEELDEETAEEEEEPEGEEEAGDELTLEDLQGMDKDELLELAEEEGVKVPVKVKRNEAKLRELLAEKLGLEEEEQEEEEEPEEKPARKSRRKTGTKTLKAGAKVTFEDDGEDIEGKVVSVNTKEGFAVIDVDGDEWEVELDDIQVS